MRWTPPSTRLRKRELRTLLRPTKRALPMQRIGRVGSPTATSIAARRGRLDRLPEFPESHERDRTPASRGRINGMPSVKLNSYRARSWVGVVALGVTLVMTVGCSGHLAASRFPLVVTTDRGAVRGVITAGGRVANYLGVAYAAPPVGTLRWRPPQPVAAWTGVRAADHYGRVCAQPSSGDGPGSSSEDCLLINVQRPALGDTRQRLPVYVYIHGGGLTTGDGRDFNMEKIVRETGVVGVTFNYRLGVFGFLAHTGLTAEQGQSGNYGFLDQQAALRWLRRNAAAFGGDPSRVTVGGESAAGWSVCAHLVSPGSRGLFAQAMIQSGACETETRDQGDAIGAGFAANAGCSDANPATAVACLRALPATDLVYDESNLGFTPVLVRGTRALPQDPRSAIRSGDFSHVPVLIGGTPAEGRAFTSSGI